VSTLPNNIFTVCNGCSFCERGQSKYYCTYGFDIQIHPGNKLTTDGFCNFVDYHPKDNEQKSDFDAVLRNIYPSISLIIDGTVPKAVDDLEQFYLTLNNLKEERYTHGIRNYVIVSHDHNIIKQFDRHYIDLKWTYVHKRTSPDTPLDYTSYMESEWGLVVPAGAKINKQLITVLHERHRNKNKTGCVHDGQQYLFHKAFFKQIYGNMGVMCYEKLTEFDNYNEVVIKI